MAAAEVFQRGQGAIIGALAIRAVADVGAESNFLLVELRFSDSGLAAAVVAADVAPEFAIHTAGGFQVPAGFDELLDEDPVMGVARVMGFHEFGMEDFVLGLERGRHGSDFGFHGLPIPMFIMGPQGIRLVSERSCFGIMGMSLGKNV